MQRVTSYFNFILSLLLFCLLNNCVAAGSVEEPLACKLYKGVSFPGFPQVPLSFEYYHHIVTKEKNFYFNTEKLHTSIYVTSLHILPVKDNIDLSNIDNIVLDLWDSSSNVKNTDVYIPVVDWDRSNNHSNNVNDIYIDQQYIQHVNISEQLDNSLLIIKMNVQGIFPEDPWTFDIEVCFSATINYN